MGRPLGALGKRKKPETKLDATSKALKAEAAARFIATFGKPWDPFYVHRLGLVGPNVTRAIRRQKRERELHDALDLLRTAALRAHRIVASERPLAELDRSNSRTDQLAATLTRLVKELPFDLIAGDVAWAQDRLPSRRTFVLKNAPRVFKRKDGKELGPREFAFIGVLAGVMPTVQKKNKKGRHDTVQDVLDREANAYARMSQRRNKP